VSQTGEFAIVIDATGLSNGAHTFEALIQDSTGKRSTWASLPFTVILPLPIVTIVSPSEIQSVKGKIEVRALISTPGGSVGAISFVGIRANNGIDSQPAKPQFPQGWNSSRKLSSSYVSNSIPGSPSVVNAIWTIDFSKSTPGDYEIGIAAEDSSGLITEKVVRFRVEKPMPVVRILTPANNQTISGAITVKVNATADPATLSKISYIALSSNQFTPQFFGQSTSSCRLDSKYVCLSVEDLKDYTWTSPISGWKDGNYALTVIAIDDSGNTGMSTVNFTVSSVAPTVTITSPSASIISRSPFTLSASTIANVSSGSEIIAVAISDRSAIPQFPGTLFGRQLTGLPSDAAIWQVANVKNPSWRFDPSTWNEGDRVINVFAIDSNGKLGQSSITIHLAPEPTWELEIQGAAVLGKSVPVLVSMTTNTPRRASPPVVIILQSARTPAGPWTDLGEITIDASGRGSGNVLVTSELYVRVNHPNLDSVQAGTSAVKRIVNVPDPTRTRDDNSSGAKNPDGSIPLVTCTVPPRVKSGARLSIVCVAQDVQNAAQPVTILRRTSSGLKTVASGSIRGTKILGTVSIKAKGEVSFILRGAGGKFVPWTSNPFTVRYN
jgi:hypothetical protein